LSSVGSVNSSLVTGEPGRVWVGGSVTGSCCEGCGSSIFPVVQPAIPKNRTKQAIRPRLPALHPNQNVETH